MRNLVLLSTGGTIATTTSEDGRTVSVGAEQLLGTTAEMWGSGATHIEARDLNRIVSSTASIGDVLSLARAVQSATERADGVVVTHGTDTIEESAFLVALTRRNRVPVVFTGAQRPFDSPAPDGPRNLAAALRWACHPQAGDTGVSVVFGDSVLPAVGVRKVHTLALNAFAAPGRAPVATIDEAGVRVHATVPPVPALLSPSMEPPRVDVVSQYLDTDATAVRAAVTAGARGIVVAGFGTGSATPEATAVCLDLLNAGIPVALASRTGAGAVMGPDTAGGTELVRAGAIPMGDLSPWQARLLLAAVLTRADDPEGTGRRCRDWLAAVGAVPQ